MIGFENIFIGNLANNVSHESTLRRLVSKSKTVEIICPFISVSGSQWLLSAMEKKSLVVSIITQLTPQAFLSGVQSHEALELLIKAGCEIKYLTEGLHAKVYRFDRKETIITSANMTNSGLNNNFEIGVALVPGIISEGLVKNAMDGMKKYIDSLFVFIERQAKVADLETLDKYRIYAEKSNSIKEAIRNFESEHPLDDSQEPYVKFDRNLVNTQNLSTEMLTTAMFEGFSLKDWDVFNHNMPINKENITKFRYLLNEKINPILKRFYSQLKSEPVFKENLTGLQDGYSQHVQLTTRFPQNRYIFLTKNVNNKRPNAHVGYPSYIIGMGSGKLASFRDTNIEGHWLEVRVGVEEDYFPKLTEYGERFLSKMVSNKEEVLKRFKSLGEGWCLSHGSYSDHHQEIVALNNVSADFIENVIGKYLITREPADLHIRRLYSVDNEKDREIIFSKKVSKVLAEDLNHLSYFFDLAHS